MKILLDESLPRKLKYDFAKCIYFNPVVALFNPFGVVIQMHILPKVYTLP